jgi:hypothetical protein
MAIGCAQALEGFSRTERLWRRTAAKSVLKHAIAT